MSPRAIAVIIATVALAVAVAALAVLIYLLPMGDYAG